MALKGGDSMTSKGLQSDDSETQDGEIRKRNDEFGDDISKEDCSTEFDSLAEAVFKLQSALDALENEVQLTRELGDESQKIINEEVHEASSSSTFNLRENTEISFHCLKKHVNTIKQDVDISKSKIDEANTKLEFEEIETEIEDLFRHKLEAELQYLVMSKTVELKSDMVDELESTSNVARDTQNNVSMLNRQAEKLETRIEDIIEIEQVSNFEKGIGQVATCLFIQLILLILVFVSYVLHLSPHNAGVVPT